MTEIGRLLQYQAEMNKSFIILQKFLEVCAALKTEILFGLVFFLDKRRQTTTFLVLLKHIANENMIEFFLQDIIQNMSLSFNFL